MGSGLRRDRGAFEGDKWALTPRRLRLRWSRWTALAAGVIALVAASPAAAPGAEIAFVRNATSDFDKFVASPTPSQQAWMRSHYDGMRGYPPFFDRALSWAPRADFYQDLYALYPKLAADKEVIAQHPDWVLRDAAGRPLYIPFACGGGTCPAHAADPGNPGWQAEWLRRARDKLARGYGGVFIDNVNVEMNVGNGEGAQVRPIDPRTGKPMTNSDWERYVAEFLERIRAELPSARITHNVIWWSPRSNPYVRRAAVAADAIELERGFNDRGLTGSGKFGYRTLLGYIDWVHGLGNSVVLEPRLASKREARYEVAGYFLAYTAGDSLASAFRADPPVGAGGKRWWRGWNTNLGRPRGRRSGRAGTLRRRFGRAVAIVNPPGDTARKVRFRKQRTNLNGKSRRKFRLKPRSGDVYFKNRRRFRTALRE